jgi:putative sigma-54 modulation protein
MDIEYTGRKITVTKKLKAIAEPGLERIAKIVRNACNVHVILAIEKYRHSAEITLTTKTYKLVASCEDADMAVALHDAVAKIEKQAIRHNQKFTTLKRHSKAGMKGPKGKIAEAAEAEAEEAVALPKRSSPSKTAAKTATKAATKTSLGRKAVPMLVHSFPSRSIVPEPHVIHATDAMADRPMSLEEAVKDSEMKDRDVFVFRDHAGLAMVLHRRRDGKMELIEIPQ